MPLANIDHTSIRTLKLEESREFYESVLGMKVGDRPDFDFPGYWLYINDHAVIHLVGIDRNNLDGLTDYLGEINMDEVSGSGAVDHLAFVATDPTELIKTLNTMNIDFFERDVPNMDLFQIFVKDPNGVTLEINYWKN
tara:strand:- start:293 stop:706 length:414 start_codon:yes stop_codon:yes gene_type:complete